MEGPANAQFKNVVYYNGNGPNGDGWHGLLLANAASAAWELLYNVEGLVVSAENGGIGL